MRINTIINSRNNARKGMKLFLFISLLCTVEKAFSQAGLQLSAPKTFIQLDTSCMTPDAMAFDDAGNIYLSVTNATTFERFGAKIIKLSPAGTVLKTWNSLPKHLVTGKVHPMGMAFADGFLYIADNQHFAGYKNASRVLRAKLENGEIQKIETIVSGLNVANGLRLNKGHIYVTETWTDNERTSGLYRFNINELNNQTININRQNRSKYLIHEMKLDKNTPDGVGMDGLDFDSVGNLYVGNFSDGVIIKIKLDINSTKQQVTRLVKDSMLVGCDGIFFDKFSNSLLIANFLENSIIQYNLSNEKLTTLWKNKDAVCNGDLDRPCDLAVIENKLVVVNFDTYNTNANKTIDNCNTISIFDVNR